MAVISDMIVTGGLHQQTNTRVMQILGLMIRVRVKIIGRGTNMADMKEIPKLYIDWGSPSGDETAVSLFDKEGMAHTITGYSARIMAEQSATIEAQEAEIKRLRSALRFYATIVNKDDAYELWYEDEGRIAQAALKGE